ncbi:two-component sensor histidine kinase [Salipaludibacillus neizhouensis]|uniref:histidine kinase n=1 Tax=Salipaludibacillus neizhouensis TaxID=885475 RepID=A0A3A9KR02_9BACI|nr:HAMP domain-containing sensor histidine kinase [Salipaludibacillus neizhouensis]RKL67106.1 two-component sensor histidine kinase [Salipaludibacillus neizhouensis]
MSTRKNKRIPLLQHWTRRYLMTLVVGLIVIGIISALWIRHTTIENRIDLTRFIAEQTAAQVVNLQEDETTLEDTPEINPQFREETEIFVVDPGGYTLSPYNRQGGLSIRRFPTTILDSEEDVQVVDLTNEGDRFYVVKAPIEDQDVLFGWVLVLQKEEFVTSVQQEYRQLTMMLLSMAVLGWAAIYFQLRRLVTPIKYVSNGARKIKEGTYQKMALTPESIKEEEVYDLVESFNEMANRLEQLEETRTALLAGVTHELKTPVTSISGLLQALDQGVVQGEEAKSFVKYSLKETEKLQTMVEDLLVFNSLAVDAIPMRKEPLLIADEIKDAVNQWRVNRTQCEVRLDISEEVLDVEVDLDIVRFQQILTNLMNNGEQAMSGKNHGTMFIHVFVRDKNVFVQVSDEGIGIPSNEQELIFERFFRGEGKKYQTRGLGLGLALSRMLAEGLGGNLTLTSSGDEGTVFTLSLPIASGEEK